MARREGAHAVFGLALVHTTLAVPFAVLITFSLFSGIPMELEEAAWTLGCTRLTAFTKVVLPLILPGITASAIFAFVISMASNRSSFFIMSCVIRFPLDVSTSRLRTASYLRARTASQLQVAPDGFAKVAEFFGKGVFAPARHGTIEEGDEDGEGEEDEDVGYRG